MVDVTSSTTEDKRSKEKNKQEFTENVSIIEECEVAGQEPAFPS